jgi:hypothetical protein
MMQYHILEIYKRVQQMAALQKLSAAQPSQKVNVNYKRRCEYCRYRGTFLVARQKCF